MWLPFSMNETTTPILAATAGAISTVAPPPMTSKEPQSCTSVAVMASCVPSRRCRGRVVRPVALPCSRPRHPRQSAAHDGACARHRAVLGDAVGSLRSCGTSWREPPDGATLPGDVGPEAGDRPRPCLWNHRATRTPLSGPFAPILTGRAGPQPQSWGPDAPGTHSEHASPGRIGRMGSGWCSYLPVTRPRLAVPSNAHGTSWVCAQLWNGRWHKT